MSLKLAKLVRRELKVDRDRAVLKLIKSLPQKTKAILRKQRGLLRQAIAEAMGREYVLRQGKITRET